MDTSFALTQTRCYQQAPRLMAKGASLSVALRGCMRTGGSRTSTATRPREPAFSRRRHRISLGHVLAGSTRVHVPWQCPTWGLHQTVNQ